MSARVEPDATCKCLTTTGRLVRCILSVRPYRVEYRVRCNTCDHFITADRLPDTIDGRSRLP